MEFRPAAFVSGLSRPEDTTEAERDKVKEQTSDRKRTTSRDLDNRAKKSPRTLDVGFVSLSVGVVFCGVREIGLVSISTAPRPLPAPLSSLSVVSSSEDPRPYSVRPGVYIDDYEPPLPPPQRTSGWGNPVPENYRNFSLLPLSYRSVPFCSTR